MRGGRGRATDGCVPVRDDRRRSTAAAVIKVGSVPSFLGLSLRLSSYLDWDSLAFSAEIVFLEHACSTLRQSSNPVCGFSMMEQVRLCAVWPMENWLGSSRNRIQDWMTV